MTVACKEDLLALVSRDPGAVDGETTSVFVRDVRSSERDRGVKKRCETQGIEAERPQGHCEGGTKADPLPADGTRSTNVPGPKPLARSDRGGGTRTMATSVHSIPKQV